ncbi:hypothetical protein [Eubacterium oxidoreducens]|uniref:Glutamate--cysteine ligase n=1 Tax=Eubacterium oxidoreducens TaxID=1732 RepID=A0A1G6A220_EUBOX|nr:hypothetical protein [Eubacterium oxidoreducens]SDB02435.1 glutamate--cysteine ligase [Eubacterium oxidoreducens]
MTQKNKINEYLFLGRFGIEKESLRVNEKGFLSHTEHPFTDILNIDRDFCENQIEIITDAFGSVDEAYEQLSQFHNIAVKRLYSLKSGKEYIWNFSNPPYVRGEQDVPIAKFDGKLKGKELYREYLASKYGKMKMLFSGIHFNFSFADEYLELLYKESDDESYRTFKDKFYLNLAKNAVRYSWLIVHLTAASPLFDGSFIKEEDLGKDIYSKYASARCSEIGYWNDFVPILNYENLHEYVNSIKEYIESGQLKTSAELYYPVRLKPKGKNTLEALEENGINHIELRTIDLNPLSDIGFKKEDALFLHYLLVYLSILEDMKFEDSEQVKAIKNVQKAALYDDSKILIETGWNKSENVRDISLKILNEIEKFYLEVGNEKAVEIIRYQKNKVINVQERYAVKVRDLFKNEYVKNGCDLAEKYAKTR